MKRYWKKGAAALLSAVLAVSGVFSAGVVYADQVTDPGPGDGEMQIATASDASAPEEREKTVSEASASDALFDEDGFLVDGEIFDDIEATASDAEPAEPELLDQLLLDQLLDPEFPEELEVYTEIGHFSDPLDNNALFGRFVDKIFGLDGNDASGGMRLRKSMNAADGLTGANALLFPLLADDIRQVAEGKLESTAFGYTAEQIGTEAYYSAEDLGVDALEEGGYVTEAALDALLEKYGLDVGLTMDALRKDLPFYLYWASYDDIPIGYSFDTSGDTVRISDVVIHVPVAEAFRGADEYSVDTAKTAAPLAARANADAVVKQYSGDDISDLKKLIGYRDTIMDLVTYDSAAASGETDSDSPWQMVYVFDGDPDTNVVCEGYSKAFKYLCDSTDFKDDSISCTMMSGIYAGSTSTGPHMWNVVSFGEDDKAVYYLADITHCDNLYEKGAFADARFLVGIPEARHDGFTIRNARYPMRGNPNGYLYTQNTRYTYDEETMTLFTDRERYVSRENYNFPVYITSADTEGHTGVANLQGGGLVYPSRLTGEGKVTLAAQETDGYRFLGWYSGEAAEGDISNASLLSRSYSDTILVEEESTLVAVYEPKGTVSLEVTGVSFTVTVDGSVTEASGSFSGDFEAGTEITLHYSGDNFVRWGTSQGVKLSGSEDYTFVLPGSMVIRAESASAAQGTSLVRFQTQGGQTIRSGQWTAKTAGANYDKAAADVPFRDGYTFTGWSMSKEEVIEAINAGTKVITITPIYASASQTCKINIVSLGDGTQLPSRLETPQYINAGQYLTLVAQDYSSGFYTFRYWALDKEGTKIISFSHRLVYGVTGDTTLYAIYGRSSTEGHMMERVPIVTIEEGSSTGSAEEGNLRYPYTIRVNIPEHYTILDAGILYDNKGKYTDPELDEETFRLDGGASRASFGALNAQDAVIARVLDKGKGVMVRGYVQVESEQYGVQTVYTEVLSAGMTVNR